MSIVNKLRRSVIDNEIVVVAGERGYGRFSYCQEVIKSLGKNLFSFDLSLMYLSDFQGYPYPQPRGWGLD
jgi:hypothetical protein